MFKIYGTEMCKDCMACKANFDENGIEYEFRDISKSLKDLAVFIKIRDLNDVFEPIKGSGKIGIPAIVREDRSVFLDWEGYLKDQGFSIKSSDNDLQACSIDGKGC